MRKSSIWLIGWLTCIALWSCKEKDSTLGVAPILIAPVNNFIGLNPAEGNTVQIFDWTDVVLATEYQWELASNPSFSSLLASDISSVSELFFKPNTLSYDTDYYWRVRTISNDRDTSGYSAVHTFRYSTTTNNPACDICGLYEGIYSGPLSLSLMMDTIFTDIPTNLFISFLNDKNYQISLDLSGGLGAPTGTLVPFATGNLSGSSLSMVDETYIYQGIASIDINGSLDFLSSDSLYGDFTFSQDIWGELTVSATKQ